MANLNEMQAQMDCLFVQLRKIRNEKIPEEHRYTEDYPVLLQKRLDRIIMLSDRWEIIHKQLKAELINRQVVRT